MKSSLQVANEVIRLGRQKSPPQYYTPMQLLKLVYIAHGWMLGVYDRKLIEDRIEAWKYGPVIPDLYQSVKGYGAKGIYEPITPWWPQATPVFDQQESNVLNYVVDTYGHYNGIMLSEITHAPQTPWSQVFRHDGWGDVIPDSVIHSHYKYLLNRAQATHGNQ